VKKFTLLAVLLGLLISFKDSKGGSPTALRGKEIDGIREDVLRDIERRFKERYKDRPEIYKAILLFAWTMQRVFEIDPTDKKQAKELGKLVEVASICLITSYHTGFKGIEEFGDEFRVLNYLETITFDTPERKRFYFILSQNVLGEYQIGKVYDRVEQKDACKIVERIKRDWEKTKDIRKINIDQLIK